MVTAWLDPHGSVPSAVYGARGASLSCDFCVNFQVCRGDLVLYPMCCVYVCLSLALQLSVVLNCVLPGEVEAPTEGMQRDLMNLVEGTARWQCCPYPIG